MSTDTDMHNRLADDRTQGLFVMNNVFVDNKSTTSRNDNNRGDGKNSENNSSEDDRCAVTFPKHGIKLSYLISEFLPIHRSKIQKDQLTTAQVCETIIKPMTEAYQSSYCDMLLRLRSQEQRQRRPHTDQEEERHDNEAVVIVSSKPNVFVSHAHSYLFLNVMSALRYHFRDDDKEDIYVWFDLFSINQHDATEKRWTFDWLSTTFKTAIQDMGRLVMIMSPWNDPLPYTRSWCVFEAYCCVVTQSTFEIALSHSDEQQFLSDLLSKGVQNSVDQMIASISSKDSHCSTPGDREQIFAVIQEQIGFAKLDSVVLEQYRQWVIRIVLKALNQLWSAEPVGINLPPTNVKSENTEEGIGEEEAAHTSNADILSVLLILAELYEGQGELMLATQCLKEYLRLWEQQQQQQQSGKEQGTSCHDSNNNYECSGSKIRKTLM